MTDFDLNEYRARRNRELEAENAMLAEQNEILMALLSAVLTMCDRAGYPWQIVLDAAVELERVDPGRMARIL